MSKGKSWGRAMRLSMVAVALGCFASAAQADVEDCNGNEIPDACDVNTLTCQEAAFCEQFTGHCQSTDANENGVPDECEACITLDKTGPEFASVGDDIVYTVDICNCDSVDGLPLSIHEITDTLQGDLWGDPGNYDSNECVSLANGLFPGDCCAITYTYTVPEGAPEMLENTATVVARPVDPTIEVTDSDDHAVQIWCQAINVVFAVDTSGSIQDEGAALCEGMQMIIDRLDAKGIPVIAELLGMVENPEGSSFQCLTGSVLATYGGDVPGTPPGCCPVLAMNEDWAAATAIIAERHAWMPDAMRVIIPVSDEGPVGGDPCEDPGPDQEGVANAANMANMNGVFVAPIMGDGTGPCTLVLAAELADLTGGQWIASTDPGDLADAVADVLEDLCRRRAVVPGELVDLCPDDPDKLTPGVCGCGVADTDDDGDGVIDCLDNCPGVFNEAQLDTDGNGVGDACEGAPLPLPAACGCGAGSGVTFTLSLLSLFGLKRTRRRRR